MGTGTISNITEAERAEFDSVLKSPLLMRSPSVLRVAEYIARKYVEGDVDGIKEYSIAVDALGKPADFDPKRDSIVRVEVHRLRKKIDAFYETEGASHQLRLVIDPGKYVPRFEPVTPTATVTAVTIQAIAPETAVSHVLMPVERRASKPKRSWRRFILLTAALLAAGAVTWYMGRRAAVTLPDPIFLIAGGPSQMMSVTDRDVVWRGDRWFKGGSAIYSGPPVRTIPAVPHNGQRFGNFDYNIPLADVPWEMRLYFGPRAFGDAKPGRIARGFDVLANGSSLLSAQDPEVGDHSPDRTVIRVFHDIRPSSDHYLHLAFRGGADVAYINAIELSPGEAGRLLPIRLIARTAPWTDSDGHSWNGDGDFATGGTLKIRKKLDPGSLDRNLILGERYGTFSYDIPVSKGAFGLKLYLSESWFGPGHAGGGGIGSRRFDVYAERKPLLLNFDIYREAGYKPVIKQFHGLTPDADGYINLTFIPRANNAAVNAMELTDETGR
jgi:hypothetical protein